MQTFTSAQELTTLIKDNQHQQILISGAGTQFAPASSPGINLSTSQHAGIVKHEPSEFVLIAKSGTTVGQLNTELAKYKQTLPVDAQPSSTLGGLIASGMFGHRQVLGGGFRSHLVGVTLVDGKGRYLRFGGQVVKNVAGYDVSRLQIGSFGCFGVLDTVSLKLSPLPKKTSVLAISISCADSVATMQNLLRKPFPYTAVSYYDNSIYVRLQGNDAVVDYACQYLATLGAKQTAVASDFFNLHKSYQSYSGWIGSYATSVSAEAIRIDFAGGLRWFADSQNAIKQAQLATGKQLNHWFDFKQQRFSALNNLQAKQFKRLKDVFDPQGVINSSIFTKFQNAA